MAASAGVVLLSNASATGADVQWPGGAAVYSIAGTFGGATATLQIKLPDNSTYTACGTGTTLTAAGVSGVWLPPCIVRVLIASGSPLALYATLARING